MTNKFRPLGQVLRGLTAKGERSGTPPWQCYEFRPLGQVLRGLTAKGERSGTPPWQSPIGIGKEMLAR